MVEPGKLSVVYSEDQIGRRVRELGEEISRDYEGRVPLFVSILKGSTIFLADLIRFVKIPLHLDFMAITSFDGGTSPGGVVRIVKDLDLNVADRDVIMIESVVDTVVQLTS